MAQMITDYEAFLVDAKRAVEELALYKESESNLHLEEKRLEKMLKAEKKAVNDSIELTVKKRIDQINVSYGQEIRRGQDRLKKVRTKREKAKNQGVKERIAEETADLCALNKELAGRTKELFRQCQVPRLCNTNFYYALYFPHSFSEIVVLLFTMLICFMVIPCLVFSLLPQQKYLYLIGIYFVTVLIFGGIYIAVSNGTKMLHLEALKKGRVIRNEILANRRKIRIVTKLIRKDRDEAVYGMEKYDRDMIKIEQELAEVVKKKKEALHTFETVTRSIIAEEITGNSRERLDQIESDCQKTTKDLTKLQERIKEKSLFIADNYEIYLEKDCLNPEKLMALSNLIQTGQAQNLTEAIALLKNR